jgi:hypothetical protein
MSPRYKHVKCIGALICQYKGRLFKVGGGLDDELRMKYAIKPPPYIEVKFKSITKIGRMREPIFVRARYDIR